ncbi:hypothetical protein HMPREF9318_01400 [Streptococcus urinalis FB127-CNA-2]|uniref:Cell division protein DivIB n=1 Tax=Streptococcus urinalis 2285-97 TaxID=764291 RepID=G5KD60_9STRE|nr:FtsQ-type POTRA domain-containing protein [Streptococcus urinalis]EHJ56833.1 POTRA domain protein, FtsQ-type [Streptococcus urinalis 2285-97]EKS19324.1 hypothetical protein HMPREF9318_01400 [Streptococcus urinalis FB127-CNA-2]VEF31455.1 Cell division protein FtsQ [Streptococcus urinalis]
MPKKKNDPPKEQPELTEWQKRNIEFLQKKKQQAEEERVLREKLRIEKKAQFQPDLIEKDNNEKSEDGENVKKEKSFKKSFGKLSLKSKRKKEKKPKTKEQRARKQAMPIFLLASLAILISLFLISPFSKQKDITVSGNKNSQTQELIQALQVKQTDYFFTLITYNQHYINNVLKSVPWVKTARLDYQFPTHFNLTVTEHRIIAYTEKNGVYQPILENGKRIDTVQKSALPKNYIIINLDKEKDIQTLISALAKFDKTLAKNIHSISLANSNSTADLLKIEMQDGNLVRVPLSEIEKKLPYYDKIKSKLSEDSIVDMEVGIYTTTEANETETSDSSQTDVSSTTADNSQEQSETQANSSETNQTENTNNQQIEQNQSQTTNQEQAGQ